MQRLVDFGERLIVLMLAAAFLIRLLPVAIGDPWIFALVASEALTVVLIVFRKGGAVSTSPYSVVIAFVGTVTPLLVGAPGFSGSNMGDALMVAGFCLALWAKLALNRRFGIIAANRGVQARGPYAFVRHPMYLGYIVTQIGYLIVAPSLYNLALYAVAWSAQVLRVIEEERFLSLDRDYRSYSSVVRRRLVPGLF